MKLELFYPCKPFNVTQAWGITNPIYGEIGFNKHNGIDFVRRYGEKTWPLYMPLKAKITDVGENTKAGKYARFISTDRYEVLGKLCYIGGIIMHMASQGVLRHQICEVGELIGMADNTGFSTGPHTHISIYRLKEDIFNENDLSNRLDTDASTNNTIDPHPYWTGFFAEDYGTVISIYRSIINLLNRALGMA